MLKSTRGQESEMSSHLPPAATEAGCEGSGAVPGTEPPETSVFPFAFSFYIAILSAEMEQSLPDFQNIIRLHLKSCF